MSRNPIGQALRPVQRGIGDPVKEPQNHQPQHFYRLAQWMPRCPTSLPPFLPVSRHYQLREVVFRPDSPDTYTTDGFVALCFPSNAPWHDNHNEILNFEVISRCD